MRFFLSGPKVGPFRLGAGFGQEPRSRFYRPPVDDEHRPRWHTLMITIPLAVMMWTFAFVLLVLASGVAIAVIRALFS